MGWQKALCTLKYYSRNDTWKFLMLDGRCSTDLSEQSKTSTHFLMIWQLQFRVFLGWILNERISVSSLDYFDLWVVVYLCTAELLFFAMFKYPACNFSLCFNHRFSLSCFLPCQLSHRSASAPWKTEWSMSPFSCSFWISFPHEKWCFLPNKDELCYVLLWMVSQCYF